MKWPWVKRSDYQELETELKWVKDLSEMRRRQLNNIRDIVLDQHPPTNEWQRDYLYWLKPRDFSIFEQTLLPIQRYSQTELMDRGFNNLMWRSCPVVCAEEYDE